MIPFSKVFPSFVRILEWKLLSNGKKIMLKRSVIVCLICWVFGISGCHTVPGINSGRIDIGTKDSRGCAGFNEMDRQKIVSYYRRVIEKKYKRMPPGLAKKQSLPPGLQKHIRKKGALPPGFHGHSLPFELERELSPLPKGYVRLKVEGDIVLMDERTRVVIDVVWGVS